MGSVPRRYWIWIIPAVVVAAGIFYYVEDPAKSFLVPKCPMKMLTGYDCPSCGAQRAIHAFLHGRFLEALSYNLFFVVAIPFLLATAYAVVMVRRPEPSDFTLRLYDFVTSRYTLYSYVAVYIIWWVVRNILGC